MQIKKGDIFILGKHRLMCGSSLSLVDVQKLLDGQIADMIFTDPPYSVNYIPETRRKGGRKTKELGGIIGDVNFPLEKLIGIINTGIVKGACYVCCGTNQIWEWYSWCHKRFKRRPTIIMWVKNGYSILARDYHSAYECMMYFYFDKKKFRGERNQNDVWFVKRANTMKYVHPTQKPVRLVQKAIINSSDKNDIVLDLFGGLGSTMVACENTERRVYLMELDVKYVDVIIKRWEALTGKKAIKV